MIRERSISSGSEVISSHVDALEARNGAWADTRLALAEEVSIHDLKRGRRHHELVPLVDVLADVWTLAIWRAC